MHWISWEKMTLPKADGGLGFKDLYTFNLAMLARQGWRLVQAPDSLCSKVLVARYFPTGDVLSAVPSIGMSYVWCSILKGIQLLKEGLIWRVGTGDNICIWQDPWIPNGPSRRPSTQRGQCILTKVTELIDPVTGNWDEALVKQTFNLEDSQAILALPIVDDSLDFLSWHFDSRGIFSVKSAYKLCIDIVNRPNRSGVNPNSDQHTWKVLAFDRRVADSPCAW
jgi:hypothetical protein